MPPVELQPNSQSVSNPGLDDMPEDPSARVINRTYAVVNDANEDPLDITVPQPEEEKVEETTETKEEQNDTQPNEEVEQQPENEEESVKQHKEAFFNDLNATFQDKLGVDFDGVIGALAELLQWRNDILSIELQQQNNPQPQQRGNTPPPFPRSSGRGGDNNPATRSYDFRQSEIYNMTPEEYDRNAQRITNAYMNNRVLKDV